ncbi:hypothetical protein TNCV_276791, partial [Trichonephila clavipes]
MESLGHSSLPPTALGRQDDEEATSVLLGQSLNIHGHSNGRENRQRQKLSR